MGACRVRHRRGFTLIETAITVVVVGVGVVSMMALIGAGTRSNSAAAQLTTAIQLANTIRDLSLGLAFVDPLTPAHFGPDTGETLATYNDVNDLDGAVFNPPVDARRQRMGGLEGWSQHITVQSVNPDRLTQALANGSSGMNRLTVDVRFNGESVYRQSWLVTATVGR